ncbi:hypothetical protein [Brevibacterium otitidis]|uniref:Uncharacterized protein n=1 Tax=Brevibacterium otitidis TaxID=53364 RepID=A0ABV5X5Y1_9MICO
MTVKPTAKWKAHLRWIILLALVPVSFFVILTVLVFYTPYSTSDEAGLLATTFALLLWFAWFGVPAIFFILSLFAMRAAYKTSDAYQQKLRSKQHAQQQRIQQQIVQQGGPPLDESTRRAEIARASHFLNRLHSGQELPAVPAFHMTLEPGEAVHHVFRAQYARCYGMDVTYTTGSTFAVGSPLFVAGSMLASAANNASVRNRAQAMAAEQWREIQYTDVFLTDRRLIIPIGGRMLDFWFNGLRAFYPDLNRMTLIFDYGEQSEPLQLMSPGIAPASVMVVNYLQGTSGLEQHPAIGEVRALALHN